MSRRLVLMIVAMAGIVAGATAFAQQHRPYKEIMKDVGATWASLKKNLDANSGAAAAQDAAKLGGLFTETEAFWTPLETKDAMNYAKNARTGLATIGAAAKANDTKTALTMYATVQKNC